MSRKQTLFTVEAGGSEPNSSLKMDLRDRVRARDGRRDEKNMKPARCLAMQYRLAVKVMERMLARNVEAMRHVQPAGFICLGVRIMSVGLSKRWLQWLRGSNAC